VGRCYTPIKVIAVFTVLLAKHHARQFKKHVRKGMVQHPVVNLNTWFRPTPDLNGRPAKGNYSATSEVCTFIKNGDPKAAGNYSVYVAIILNTTD
jgi:hypothetical protein